MRNRVSRVQGALAWTCGLVALGIAILESGGAATGVAAQNIGNSTQLSPGVQSIITVTNNNDSGIGSLRQAILGASFGDTIVFAPHVAGVIALTSGTLIITTNLTIQGPGPDLLAVSGNHTSQVFWVYDAGLGISGLTVRDGNTPGCGGGFCVAGNAGLILTNMVVMSNTGGLGGGISNYAVTTVISSSILNNVSYGEGGGINNVGRLFVVSSIISGNQSFVSGGAINSCCIDASIGVLNSAIINNRSARHAGGIGIATGGTASINNTTISGNVSESDGGGGLHVYGTVALFSSTVVSNTGRSGGGVRNLGGTVLALNTIVADSVSGGNCVGWIQSRGHNLSSDATCNLTNTGDLRNVSPVLGPLTDNGGRTPTHLLLAGRR